MNKKIRSLFALQEFEQDPRLSRLIAETEKRYSRRSLTDDEIEYVSAAGAPETMLWNLQQTSSDKKEENDLERTERIY